MTCHTVCEGYGCSSIIRMGSQVGSHKASEYVCAPEALGVAGIGWGSGKEVDCWRTGITGALRASDSSCDCSLSGNGRS
jgi:hypothetical protein